MPLPHALAEGIFCQPRRHRRIRRRAIHELHRAQTRRELRFVRSVERAVVVDAKAERLAGAIHQRAETGDGHRRIAVADERGDGYERTNGG